MIRDWLAYLRHRKAIKRRLAVYCAPHCRACIVAAQAGPEGTAAHRLVAHRFDRRAA